MARADYYLCDVCGTKCFYDAPLNWELGPDGSMHLDDMGDMRAICKDCSETHEVVVRSKGASTGEA